MVLSKIDLSNENFDKMIKEISKMTGEKTYKISSLNGVGLEELIQHLFKKCLIEND